MRVIKYSQLQIEELKTNKYVKSCTNKNINFTKEFKYKAIELSEKGLFYKEIFEKLGFPKYVVNSEIPRNSINRWKKNNLKGKIENKKGRPKKENIDFDNMTLGQENEYLKAKLALYEELEKHINSGYP